MSENQEKLPGYVGKSVRSRSSGGELGAESLVKELLAQKFPEKSLLKFTFSTAC